MIDDSLKEEAEAFNKRISDRVEQGFIPDLRRAKKTEYFYKSFWRDPQFIDLYLGEQIRIFLEILGKHCNKAMRILDVGCGAGYMSLELARHGYDVTAIDISEDCIAIANKMLSENTYQEGFGRLNYQVMSFEDVQVPAEPEFDIVLFSVSLHHMRDVDSVIKKCHALLPPDGCLFAHEPCHEKFTERDAAQVFLIRSILSITGNWFEHDAYDHTLEDKAAMLSEVQDTRLEYFHERDKNEPDGQSPHDLEASGEEMLSAMRASFQELEFRKSTSFIYRLLGGIRGDEQTIKKLADLFATYDRMSVEQGFINENFFYFLGRKKAV